MEIVNFELGRRLKKNFKLMSRAWGKEKNNLIIFLYTDPVLVLPSNITAFVGDSIWLHCAARGSPTARITWFKSGQGGKPLDKERFILHENGSMIIRDVQLKDKGAYFCLTIANIKQGTRYLEVKGKPPSELGIILNFALSFSLKRY